MHANQVLKRWKIRKKGSTTWRQVDLPGCWEALGYPMDDPGPYQYATRRMIPRTWNAGRTWLRFGAVSYLCRVWVNGQEVGTHTGMWDAFEYEITPYVQAGQVVEILVEVEKPASLVNGPDSAHVSGGYPLRKTLSGFLPYVWGHALGGVWQAVKLVYDDEPRVKDVVVCGRADGAVMALIELDRPGELALEIRDAEDSLLRIAIVNQAESLATYTYELPDPHPWNPENPYLYSLIINHTQHFYFGLRSLAVAEQILLLNGRPLYPRLALSWGWYADRLSPDPGSERVRQDLLRLRALGFNGVKLCLWFPPEYYFQVADELGMLVWLELPMWIPLPDEAFRKQALEEYVRLVKQARRHPSVLIVTLGCELDAKVEAEFLEELYRGVRGLLPQPARLEREMWGKLLACPGELTVHPTDGELSVRPTGGEVLLRDNSGSGEAYGGLLTDFAEFYDNHFYSDDQFLPALLDGFAPAWREPKPWLMGEFCDADTLRDFPTLLAPEGRLPWWLEEDSARNPVGARWEYRANQAIKRLRAYGLYPALDPGGGAGGLSQAAWDGLVQASYRQMRLHRKLTLEAVRRRADLSGYVITGEVDTPVSTAGIWTDPTPSHPQGTVKHAANEWRAMNDDLVILPGWDRQRTWLAGGDRLAEWDHWNYLAGRRVRLHLIVSNFTGNAGPFELRWEARALGGIFNREQTPSIEKIGPGVVLSDDQDQSTGAIEPSRILVSGQVHSIENIAPGQVGEVGVVEFGLPVAPEWPRCVLIKASIEQAEQRWSNAWLVWVYPPGFWSQVTPFTLLDPMGWLDGLSRLAPGKIREELDLGRPAVCTSWNTAVQSFVEAGGQVILLQARQGPPGPLPVVELPYWREALKIVMAHPAWGDFPHENDPGLQFYGLAPDCALQWLDVTGQPLCDEWQAQPIYRRLDLRGHELHEYAVELQPVNSISRSGGRVVASTLRLQGGLGDQPAGITRHLAGQYLLAQWLGYLQANIRS